MSCFRAPQNDQNHYGFLRKFNKKQLKKSLKFIPLDPDTNDVEWKTNMIIEITNTKRNFLKIGTYGAHCDDHHEYDSKEISSEDQDTILSWICTSWKNM